MVMSRFAELAAAGPDWPPSRTYDRPGEASRPVPGSARLFGGVASLVELRAAVWHAAAGSPSVVMLTG